jgi:hypothetical protein
MDRVLNHGVLSRRRLLGAGAVAGATTLTGLPSVAAAPPAPRQLAPTGGIESKTYAGLSLVAGNELDVATSTVFVKDPINGSFPSTANGYVGASLDVPAGSLVVDVVFYLYQSSGQQLCAVQLYHLAAPTNGYDIILSQTADGTGVLTLSTAAHSASLPRLVTATDALTAFVWRGEQTAVCRGIRVDYMPPNGGVGAAGGGLTPIPPARVYDSRQSGGKLANGEERPVSVATALSGAPVVPLGATAAFITLTVTDTEGPGGYVAAFQPGTPWSGTSSVNWFGAGQNLATAAMVALGSDRDLILRGGTANTHVIVDVTGYVA